MPNRIYFAVLVGLINCCPANASAIEAQCASQVQQCQLADNEISIFANTLPVLKHQTSATVSSLSAKIAKLSKLSKKTAATAKKLRSLKTALRNARSLLTSTQVASQQALARKSLVCTAAAACVQEPIAPLPPVEVCTNENGDTVDCATLHYCEQHPGACFGPPPTPEPVDETPVVITKPGPTPLPPLVCIDELGQITPCANPAPVDEEGSGISQPAPLPVPVVFCLDEAGQLGPCANPAPCNDDIRGCVEIIGPPMPAVQTICQGDAGEVVPCETGSVDVEEGLLIPVLRRGRN